MSETEFNRRVDDLLIALEDALDASGADVDYESSGGVLTISCEANGSKVIVSRQPVLAELWVAARSGGYHLALEEGTFRARGGGETLAQLLSRVLTEQCGETVAIEIV